MKVLPIIFILVKIRPFRKLAIMNTNTIGYWNEKKEKLKQKYPFITDEDLFFSEGKEREMMEILGYKLGKTFEEVRNIFATL